MLFLLSEYEICDYNFVIILFSNNISIILKNLLNFFICIKGVKVYIKKSDKN